MSRLPVFNAEIEATTEQITLLESRRDDLQQLVDKNLTSVGELNNIKIQIARLKGRIGELRSRVAGSKASISERQLTTEQLRAEKKNEVLKELQSTDLAISELLEEKIDLESKLERLIVRAPVNGIVHDSVVQTIGGVVTPSQTMMEIIPSNDVLAADIRVRPIDIDRVQVDQAVILTLASFDPRQVPEIHSNVQSVSADLTVDKNTGAEYYEARVTLPKDELKKIPAEISLVQGMPIEGFVVLQDRTVLAYLIKPIMDNISKVWQEE